MNKVILLGRLTHDPELRQTPSNILVATFTVAVNRPYQRDRDQPADFIDCVAWRGGAEFVSKYFSKGKPILVEGKLQARDWKDKNGSNRRSWEVLCDQVSFVEGAAREKSKPDEDPRWDGPAKDTGGFQEVDSFGDLPF